MTEKTAIAPAPATDPLIAALARYVEAVHRRYPDGPDELLPTDLDCQRTRANMPTVLEPQKDPVA